MSYYLEAIKDTPIGLYMFDSDGGVDTSGKGANGVVYGTDYQVTPPLVNGAVTSVATNASGSYVAFPFAYCRPGTERQPFTLEGWIFPIDSTSLILAHASDSVGLSYFADTVLFKLNFTSAPSAQIAYYPNRKSLLHCVAVYTGTAMELHVNGVLVNSYELSDAQRADSFVLAADNGYVYVGAAKLQAQALATYNYALKKDQILAHYNAGMESTGSFNASSIFAGRHIELSDKKIDTFNGKEWTNFVDGYGTAKTDDYGVSSAVDPVTGAYIASTWEGSFELDSGGTSIDGVQIDWDGQYVHYVETSLDNGVTWTAATNNKRVSGISAGYNPTDKILLVRVRFIAGSYGIVSRLKLLGIKSLTLKTGEKVPATLPAGTNIGEQQDIHYFDYNTGADMTGTLTIGPDSEESPIGTKSLSFWYYADSGATLSTDFAGTHYTNATAQTFATKTKVWTHVVWTNPTASTSAINITASGGRIRIAYPVLYDDELSASDVQNIYIAYLGAKRYMGLTTDTIATINDTPASIYAANWSIQPAG